MSTQLFAKALALLLGFAVPAAPALCAWAVLDGGAADAYVPPCHPQPDSDSEELPEDRDCCPACDSFVSGDGPDLPDLKTWIVPAMRRSWEHAAWTPTSGLVWHPPPDTAPGLRGNAPLRC